MKIATFNVNGIKTRLPNLLQWLEREQPDVACLQELKALDGMFPHAPLREAGYHAVWKGQRSWNGVAILARGIDPVEIRRELPGDPADDHSRYLEAAVDGVVVACLYLPNGNPQPGPKFDYKLAWFERLIAHAAGLYASDHPVVMAGDYNVVPTDFDIYNPRSWLQGRTAAARKPRVLPAPAAAGLDRFDPPPASAGSRLHVLGLLSQALGPRCGPAHRPPAAQRRPGAVPGGSRRGPLGARRRSTPVTTHPRG